MAGEGFKPMLAFDRDDAEFVNGFEMGRFWTQVLASPEELIDGYLHSQNVEMAMRIGEATRRMVDSLELADNWIWVRFHPAGSLDDVALVCDEPMPNFNTGDEAPEDSL